MAVSCGVGGRRGLDLALLWLWCRLAAVAPIRPLAWASTCHRCGPKKSKKKKKKIVSPPSHLSYYLYFILNLLRYLGLLLELLFYATGLFVLSYTSIIMF